MHKRWALVASGIAAVAVLLVAGQVLLSRDSSPQSTQPTPPAEQPGSTAAAPATAAALTATPAPAGRSAESSLPSGQRRLIAPLPGGKVLARIKPTGVARPGDALHPLASSPPALVAGFAVGRIPTGSAYTVTFRPWGYGPANGIGQTVAVSVTKAVPLGDAPDVSSLTRHPLLLTMDADNGGNVASGGVHAATLTFVAQGDGLVPVLTNVQEQRP